MPTVKRSGAYRFSFYSKENDEPPHIHVNRDDLEAKFWLDPVALAANFGFASHELNRVRRMVTADRDLFLRAWHDYFGDE
jgi:hypothetical protein